MSGRFATIKELFQPSAEHTVTESTSEARMHLTSTKTLSAARILFGAVFLFDGILKWVLFQQGQMQATVQSFGYDYLSNNWVVVGAVVGVGETLAGAALIAGLFHRPAAIGAAGIMGLIWGFGGFNGVYSSGTWSFVGYTDLGGDLMLAMVFALLAFAPAAYGLASRLRLRERFAGNSLRAKTLRFLIA